MRTITIANQKGGCGKTTVAINLSASLAREARRVLLVDLDPQAHCAVGMAVPEEQIDLSIFDCLLGQIEGESVELSRITWQIAPNLSLAPSRSSLANLEPKLGLRDDAESVLKDVLAANASRYDYCVVDGPPHIGLLVRNGLRAADDVIIPVDTGYFSLHGLTRQLATIEQLSERHGSRPVVRILANQYDVRTKLGREILAELRKRFTGLMCETVVNFNTKLKEGASFGQPITEFAPTSMGARDFQMLARELMVSEPQAAPTPDLMQHVERLAADAERLLATTTTLVGNRGPTPSEPTTIERSRGGTAGALPTVIPPTCDDADPGNGAQGRIGQVAGAHSPAGAAATPETQKLVPLRARSQNGSPAPAKTPVSGATADQTLAESTGPMVPATAETAEVRSVQRTPDAPASSEEIDRKIEAVYGVRQQGDIVIFRSRNPDAGEVQVAGDFNDWMPHATPMQRLANGDFETRVKLPKGRYRYRLVIDGRWSHDHYNPAVETNEYGELNSVVEVTR